MHADLTEAVVLGSVQPNNLVEVRTDDGETLRAVMVTNVMSGLLGLRTTFFPEVNSRVLLLNDRNKPGYGYVVGCMPSGNAELSQPTRNLTGGASFSGDSIHEERQNSDAPMMTSHQPMEDLIAGELDISNLHGVGIALLNNMAMLRGGDLARIEAHLLDDMVRIVSRNFQQHTDFGSVEVKNDGGRLSTVTHGTSHGHEGEGERRQKDGHEDDPDKVDEDAEGRWRFSNYVGWLGNFINMFVTDPVDQIGKLASDALRQGKARVHVNEKDGSIVVQSAADIVFEHVTRIPVPIEQGRSQDPTKNRSDESQVSTYAADWKPSGSLFEMAYQLRDYARWLNQTYSLERFHQQERDFVVPSERDTGTTMRYSTMRIFRDGSILHLDAYGNSFLTNDRGVSISSPQDITIMAGGSLNLVGGRDINMVGRRHVTVSACEGHARVHGKTGLQLLSSAGHIVLETLEGWLTKLRGVFQVNDNLQVDVSGDIHHQGNIFGQQIHGEYVVAYTLAQTPPNFAGLGPHPGHVATGQAPTAPDIINIVDEEFEFPADYGGGALYESLTQQMMREGEVGSAVSWNLDSNEVSGKGSPWPGAEAFKAFTGGQSLQSPSSAKVFNNTMEAGSSRILKAQS